MRTRPLDNETGTIRLQRPDTLSGAIYPQVTEDEVIYLNSAPWPTPPDGTGATLQRSSVGGFGNFASSWTSDAPNPGGKILDYDEWSAGFFGPGNPPNSGVTEDFDLDGIPNIVEFALNMNPTTSDLAALPEFVNGGNEITVEFEKNLLRQGFTVEVQTSPDLVVWSGVPDTLESTTDYVEVRKATISTTGSDRLFVRFFVTHL